MVIYTTTDLKNIFTATDFTLHDYSGKSHLLFLSKLPEAPLEVQQLAVAAASCTCKEPDIFT